MAGYEDTKQKIISTLMGRPAGTEIQPENHQDYALNMLDYIRSLELIATSTLIGVAESNSTPVQPNVSRVCYIAGVAQNQTVTFENFIGENGNPISVTTGDMEGVFIILMWNTQYWSAQTFSTNIISQSESATFYYRYNIRKTYESIALMNADVASPIGTDGKYIKIGDIVTVVNSTTPSENGIYSYEGTTDGWKFQSSFNFQVEQIRSQNTNTAPSSKLLDDELVQVRSDLSGDYSNMFVPGAIPVSGIETDSDTVWEKSQFIKVSGGDIIELYAFVSNDIKLISYYTDASATSNITSEDIAIAVNQPSPLRFTVPNGVNYARVCLHNGTVTTLYNPHFKIIRTNGNDINTNSRKINVLQLNESYKGIISYSYDFEKYIKPIKYIKIWSKASYENILIQLMIATWDGSNIIFGVGNNGFELGRLTIPSTVMPTGCHRYKGVSTDNNDIYYDIVYNWDDHSSNLVNPLSDILVEHDLINSDSFISSFSTLGMKGSIDYTSKFVSGAIPMSGLETNSDTVWGKSIFIPVSGKDKIKIYGYATPDIKIVSFYSQANPASELSELAVAGDGALYHHEIEVPINKGINFIRICIHNGTVGLIYYPTAILKKYESIREIRSEISVLKRRYSFESPVLLADWIYEDGMYSNRLYSEYITKDSIVNASPLGEYFDALKNAFFSSETMTEDGYVKIYAIVKPTIDFRVNLIII